jgi:predicted nucleotidyltransferase
MKRQRLAGAELEAYLAGITDAMVRAFAPKRVILFGSLARGDQNRASDADLVVIASTSLPFAERIGRGLEACYAFSTRMPVEVLVYTPAEWESMTRQGSSFATLVETEGRLLYDDGTQPARSATLVAPIVARP